MKVGPALGETAAPAGFENDGAGPRNIVQFARVATMELVATFKDLRAFDGGSLANAVGLEMFSAAILTVNLRSSERVTLSLVST